MGYLEAMKKTEEDNRAEGRRLSDRKKHMLRIYTEIVPHMPQGVSVRYSIAGESLHISLPCGAERTYRLEYPHRTIATSLHWGGFIEHGGPLESDQEVFQHISDFVNSTTLRNT